MNGRWPPGSVGAALQRACTVLEALDVETARLDARVLMGHVLGQDQAWLFGHADDPIDASALSAFDALIARRGGHEPVAYLTKVREFWSLPFQVSPDTLIPRPDSETLVAAALEHLDGGAARILDFGTGSGCLLLSVLSEATLAKGHGIDASPGAVNVAAENARRLGLADRSAFRVASWADDADWLETTPYDLVIANPPYIPAGDMAGLEPDVRSFEPARALDGGEDGLSDYRMIARRLADVLVPGGMFIGEFGLGQGVDVAGILNAQGLDVAGFRNDAAGRQRCILASRPGP